VTIRELLADWEGEVLRLAMLSTHYRQPINWTRQGIGFAAKTLDKWYRVVGDVEADTGPDNPFESEIADRLGDDLNSPRAITHLHHLAEVAEHEETSSALRRRFKGAANLLGLLQLTETQWKARQREAIAVDPEAIEALIAARIAARKARDFAAADHIREQLAAQGVILMDNKDGTTSWELGR
ncbi:MAG: cysteine--tRNA ligase, partial [Azorhizobium sp. 35-67-5]